MRVLFLSLLVCLSAHGQLATIPGGGTSWSTPSAPPVFNPTNGFGISAAGWWSPSYSAYTTNTGVLQANLTSLGSDFDLTNKAAASTWQTRIPAGLNGYDYLVFIGPSSFLESINWTSPPVSEVFIVAAITNAASTESIIDGRVSGAEEQFSKASGTLQMFAGSLINVSVNNLTNKWAVFDVVYTGTTGATVFTNNIATTTGDAGSQGSQGLILGNNRTKGFGATMSWVEAFIFTNVNLTTQQRSNAYWYCTNRYNLSP